MGWFFGPFGAWCVDYSGQAILVTATGLRHVHHLCLHPHRLWLCYILCHIPWLLWGSQGDQMHASNIFHPDLVAVHLPSYWWNTWICVQRQGKHEYK